MSLPKDKLLHVGAGVLLGLSALIIGKYAFIPVIGIAIGKEVIWDKMMGKGTFEIADAVATILPGSFVAAIILNYS